MNSETSLKPAIRKLIHSSQVKPEAVGVIVAELENENVTVEDWENLFNKEGADIAIKQKIYSPQMVRLITLRAIVIPETLPQFLAWLNIQAGKKLDENQTVSLEFQRDIRPLFPQEQLTKGIKYLLVNLLSKQISVDCVYWLLTTDSSAWVYAQKEFISDVKYDLKLMDNYFIRQYKNGFSDNFFDFFKCHKQVWTSLISNWQAIQKGNHKSEEYQPLAELLARLKEYELAAYFYQVSQGHVTNDLFYNMTYEKYLRLNPNKDKLSKILFYEVNYQKLRNSNITVYRLQIKRKPTLVKFIDHVLDFITQEYIVPIQFVIPLSLLILVSGWFIGAKNWESYTDKTDIEKSLDSKTFKKDDKNNNREIVRSELKDKPGAIDDYTQAIKINPNDAEAYSKRGIVRYDLGDKQGAIDDYTQAIKINPNYALAYSNRGNVRYDLGDKPGAIDDYTQAIKINPNDALAYYNRGVVRYDLGDKQGAIKDYNQAIKFNPNYADAYYGRGIVRNDLGDKQGAIKDYNQAIKFNPNYAYAYNNRGNVRYDLGDKQEAIDDYTQAIKINPNYAQAYYNRGIVRYDLGDKQEAIDDYTQAAKLYQQQGKNQDYQDALNRIRELQQ